jgi:CRP/FNR family transcriptional regulator/CRP/FNR family cyclic AMP-dependent transcriptional regulator
VIRRASDGGNSDTIGHAAVEQAMPLLRRVSLFADLTDDELVAIARVMRARASPRGTMILTQDEPGHVAFVIVKGAVDILLESEDGRQFIVAQLGPGDHFGEMSLLDAEPRSATVVATADTELLVIRRDEFLAELLQRPRIMLRMLVSLSRRLRRTDAQVASLAFGDTADRLAQLLMANARPGPRGPEVEVAQEDLAAMVGATRQTVGRIFSAWRREGYILTGRRRTIILDAAALGAVARS